MSCSYADGLSPYEYKGKLGQTEIFDSTEDLKSKVLQLSKWISCSKHVVVHTGAGISTSAGIPDFRGPKGVWTLEQEGKKPELSISFNDAMPTKTHMALVKLLEAGFVKYIVSQNIDGLHMKSGIGRDYISELHGNMFIDQCSSCKRQFIRKTSTSSVGQKCLGLNCPGTKGNGRACRGLLHDFVLDWEASLPEKDLDLAHYHSNLADLSICLGTTLQIIPSGNLPTYTKKNSSGLIVICNLQPTKIDKKADLLLHGYVDEVMSQLMECLDLKIEEYKPESDPVMKKGVHDWTIPDVNLKKAKKMYEDQIKLRKSNGGTMRKKRHLDDLNTFSNRQFKKLNEDKPIVVKTEMDSVIKNELDDDNHHDNLI